MCGHVLRWWWRGWGWLDVSVHSVSWCSKTPRPKTRRLCTCVFSPEWLFVTPWTIAHQAPLSMGFSRQECWSELPFPSAGDLLTQGLNPGLFCLLCAIWEAWKPTDSPFKTQLKHLLAQEVFSEFLNHIRSNKSHYICSAPAPQCSVVSPSF